MDRELIQDRKDRPWRRAFGALLLWPLSLGIAWAGASPGADPGVLRTDSSSTETRTVPAPAVHSPGLVVRATPQGGLMRIEGGWPGGSAMLLIDRGDRGDRGRLASRVPLDGEGAWLRRFDAPGAEALEGARVLVRLTGARGKSSVLAVPRVEFVAEASAPRGDVIVTEFMKDPAAVSDSVGEWIEIQNVSSVPVNIEGMSLEDHGSNYHRIENMGQRIWLQPGQRFVLANQGDFNINGGFVADYAYKGITLSNGADEIVLRDRAGRLVDEVVYDDGVQWPDEAGRSVSLSPTAHGAGMNNDGGLWCPASSAYGLGDDGTPGAANDPCP